MAFAIDHPIRRRQPQLTNVVLPKYDVKIVAGKRIVIFHPEEVKKADPDPEPEPEPEVADKEEKPETGKGEDAKKVEPEVEVPPEPGKPDRKHLSTNGTGNEKPTSSR